MHTYKEFEHGHGCNYACKSVFSCPSLSVSLFYCLLYATRKSSKKPTRHEKVNLDLPSIQLYGQKEIVFCVY